MIHQFSQDARADRLTRWNTLAIAASILLGLLVVPSLVRGKTIFDDDWVPPKSDTPVQPPAQTPPATQPVTPAESVKPETSVNSPPPPPTVAVPVHRPIPAKADQAKSRKLFKEFYAADLANRSAAARRALATKLLEQAGAVSDAPSDQFVLLVGATEAAKEACDLALVSRAADALAEAYEVDGLHLKSDAATQMALRADSPPTTTENCHSGLELVDQLAAAGDFVTALHLLKSLQAAAPDAEVRSQIQSKTKEVDAQKTVADRIAMFSQKLRTAPDDPVANLAVGQHLCFVRGDWAHGLPLLAKGNDANAKDLATQELKGPSDADGQMALADGWWTYAGSRGDAEKTAIQSHAQDYYRKAMPELKGLARLKVETRLPKGSAVITANTQATNLLDGVVHLDRDVERGSWRRTSEGVAPTHDEYSALKISLKFPSEYDIKLSFTCPAPLHDDSIVALRLPLNGTFYRFGLQMVSNNSRTRVGFWEGEHTLADSSNTVFLKAPMEGGVRTNLLLQARSSGVRVVLNGKLVYSHEGYDGLKQFAGPFGVIATHRATFHELIVTDPQGRGISVPVTASDATVPLKRQAISPEPTTESMTVGRGGAVVDLLKLDEQHRKVLMGNWTMGSDGLQSESGGRILFDYSPPEEYDIHIEFMRLNGDDGISLFCPLQNGTVAWVIGSGARKSVSGGHKSIGFMDYAKAEWHPIKLVPFESGLTTGQSAAITIKVRRGSIEGIFNDQPPVTLQRDGTGYEAGETDISGHRLIGLSMHNKAVINKLAVTGIPAGH